MISQLRMRESNYQIIYDNDDFDIFGCVLNLLYIYISRSVTFSDDFDIFGM